MGTLRSTTDHSGIEVNGVLLGVPAERDGLYLWDDPALRNGEMLEDGTIVPDEVTP